ncbi:RDD family protein [Nocardia sp. NPDC050408]|uniref:RDD family protein n=1 Tax=unclassified Nocardia TaxID=2637762 RepID=UPI003414BBBB
MKARFEHPSVGSLRYVDPTQKPDRESTSLTAGRRRTDGSIENPGGPTTIAFMIDMLLHSGVGTAAWLVVTEYANPDKAVAAAVVTWIATSFMHRTVIQRIGRTTLGKSLFNLRLHYLDETQPTLWQLIKLWLFSAFAVVATPLQFLG